MRELSSFTHLLNTAEELAEAVESYAEAEANNFADIDPELVPILKNLNYVPGLATRFCCASHPEVKEFGFYICFVVNESGLLKVLSLFNSLKTKLATEAQTANPKKNPFPDTFSTVLEFGTRADWDDWSILINALTLRVVCKTPAQKARIIKVVLELSSTIHA